MKSPNDWLPLYDATNADEHPLPGHWDKDLNLFEKLIVLKAIRTDKVVPAVEKYIEII